VFSFISWKGQVAKYTLTTLAENMI